MTKKQVIKYSLLFVVYIVLFVLIVVGDIVPSRISRFLIPIMFAIPMISVIVLTITAKNK